MTDGFISANEGTMGSIANMFGALVFVIILCSLMIYVGYVMGRDDMRHESVKHGYGEYKVSDEGRLLWRWKQ